jgi:hypothetical protein
LIWYARRLKRGERKKAVPDVSRNGLFCIFFAGFERKLRAQPRVANLEKGSHSPNKRNPDARTPASLTRENCSRGETRAGRIPKRISPADRDHLYQRVTQLARASPPFKQAWSMKAAARNYYAQNADIRPCYAHFLPQRYDRLSC